MNGDYRKFSWSACCGRLGLSGCATERPGAGRGSQPQRPPRRRARRSSAPSKPQMSARRHYRVQRGDTLYSIAFRHGVDYRDLAEWNSIPPPYTIYPGRELRLSVHLRATAWRRRVAQAAPRRRPVAWHDSRRRRRRRLGSKPAAMLSRWHGCRRQRMPERPRLSARRQYHPWQPQRNRRWQPHRTRQQRARATSPGVGRPTASVVGGYRRRSDASRASTSPASPARR